MKFDLKFLKDKCSAVITRLVEGEEINKAIGEEVESDWNEEKVKRLIEMTNHSIYRGLVKKNNDEKIAFELAELPKVKKYIKFDLKPFEKKSMFNNDPKAVFLAKLSNIYYNKSEEDLEKIASASVDLFGENSMFCGVAFNIEYGYEHKKEAVDIQEHFEKNSSFILDKIKNIRTKIKGITSVSAVEKPSMKKKAFLNEAAGEIFSSPYFIGTGVVPGIKRIRDVKNFSRNVRPKQILSDVIKDLSKPIV